MLKLLKEREKEILKRFYTKEIKPTYSEVARDFNISPTRVKQIYIKAREKLKLKIIKTRQELYNDFSLEQKALVKLFYGIDGPRHGLLNINYKLNLPLEKVKKEMDAIEEKLNYIVDFIITDLFKRWKE